MQCALHCVANALRAAGWERCGDKSRLLRKHGVPIIGAPHRYISWAVIPTVYAPLDALRAVRLGLPVPRHARRRTPPRAYREALQRVHDEVLLLTLQGRSVNLDGVDLP
jgi:hypothetical protein